MLSITLPSSEIWSLFAPIHMKKKLTKSWIGSSWSLFEHNVQIGSPNLKKSSGHYICIKLHDKLTKVKLSG